MTQKNIKSISSKKQLLTIRLAAIWSSLFLFFSQSAVAYADANAKDASNYILNDWIAPIFGVVVVYLVIKEFLNSKWIQGFAILFFGGIIYAVIKDPTGILNSLSNLKSYFGL
ncbi:hypothetical protein ACEXFN_000671 [Listeria monocytogenes]|uniref:Uncharacterized protein n=1 Tax=Listeria monocytogenes TaxID=1639 RepID=A0AAD2RBU5_LISMN|nr:TcpD family membrane protein [Listeria monocytogenes]MCZ62151.1 hypothetical protein [Listeria monocytogenes serotype 4b]HAA0102773.1 hypothetical protein [Listeria monocytogenes CC70B]AQP73382.1 hypothetical protein B0X18_04740 [Listeria monocytogenes]ASH66643.1 hypothetical protein A417_0978 [Listeria monocytogenes serotype 4b str. 02-1103]ASH69561.1 hypothetical protein A418_0978 [Listeria monocytogenes serotype 4b str. 02-1289]